MQATTREQGGGRGVSIELPVLSLMDFICRHWNGVDEAEEASSQASPG
jgi:hypothetical protein